ncbi:MAG: hypothetical protein WCC27_10740, partial [Acidobacteriaceae bacterium]
VRRSAFGKTAVSFQRSAFSRAAMGWFVATTLVGLAGAVGAQGAGQSAPVAKALVPYTTCSFPDGLRVVEATPLATGVASRPVETASGTQLIEMDAAEQVTFGYPLTDLFANAKVELLPAARYPAMKRILLANLAFLESERNGPTAARALPVGLHGFEVHGNDLRKLAGNMLGMYVLFDDKAHVATTVYFLNQQAWQRKFQTMEAYGRLRDSFLRNYTGCVRVNQAVER